jgi:hypothetical protein
MTEEFLAGHELNPQMLTMGSNGAIKQAVCAGLRYRFNYGRAPVRSVKPPGSSWTS